MKGRTYLMSAGTFLPAFAAVGFHMAYHKRMNLKFSDLVIFAGVSVIGALVTIKMLEKYGVEVQDQ